MSPQSKRYDPEQCLRRAECYIDRTVDPPVIRPMKAERDYEIIGWVWLTTYGELKSNGVDVKPGEELGGANYFVYKGKKYPPGIYFLSI